MMKVNIDIDDKHTEPSVTIQTNEWSDELEEILAIIKRNKRKRIFGVEADQTILLDPNQIEFVYAEKRKVFARIGKRKVEVRLKLYELEDILAPYDFMRFSKSVIGNLNQIERFELSFNGNLCVYFYSKNKEYITRKYVAPIKNRLAMGGQTDDH